MEQESSIYSQSEICEEEVTTKIQSPVLEKNLNINEINNEGKTPFHYFCASKSLSVNSPLMIYLIEGGADMSIKDNEGKTALEYFLQNHSWEGLIEGIYYLYADKAPIVKSAVLMYLIERGADMSIKDNKGKTGYSYFTFACTPIYSQEELNKAFKP